MKDTKNKLSYNIRYAFYLLSDLMFILGISFLFYALSNGYLIIVYIANALFIIGVLAEEKFWHLFSEKWYKKLKKDGFLKRRLKEFLAAASYRPSIKVALYVYYLICIAADRLFYFGLGKNIALIDDFKNYLSIMYYSFILLMALDKVKEVMSKENRYHKTYYGKFLD